MSLTKMYLQKSSVAGLMCIGLILGLPKVSNASNPCTVESGCLVQDTTPATVCKVWGGNSGMVDNLIYSQYGKIENNHSTNRLGVVCPVYLPPGVTAGTTFVSYNDANSNSGNKNDIHCRLRLNTFQGTSSSQSVGKYGEEGSGNLTFSPFGSVNTNVGGHYTLLCYIPSMKNGNRSSIGGISHLYTSNQN